MQMDHQERRSWVREVRELMAGDDDTSERQYSYAIR